MSQTLRSRHARKKTTLFAQIMMRLSIPLVILSVFFITIQLTNQMGVTNELYKLKSRAAIETLHQTLRAILRESGMFFSYETARFESIRSVYQIGVIHLRDFNNQRSLFRSPENDEWLEEDTRDAQISIENKKKGFVFYPRIEKIKRKLTVYIPVERSASSTGFVVAKLVFSLASLEDALRQSRLMLIAVISLIFFTGLVIARSLTDLVVRPLRMLNSATQELMSGKLGKHADIRTGNEIELLANAFNQMSDNLEMMKEQAQDANPLTNLPGNRRIFNELQRRIHERHKFVLFHADLNRFKVFNDHFGLAKGDDAIKKTGVLLAEALHEKGSREDFIGHQGGDDFIIIISPSRADAIGKYICEKFDAQIVKTLYSKEDYERGFTEQFDRRRYTETGEKMMIKFPLISIGLAGISNVHKDFADYYDCMERAIAAKKEVKQIVQSAYLIH